jgi:hypothetical protein
MDFDFSHAVYLGKIADSEQGCRHGSLSAVGLFTLSRHPPRERAASATQRTHQIDAVDPADP